MRLGDPRKWKTNEPSNWLVNEEYRLGLQERYFSRNERMIRTIIIAPRIPHVTFWGGRRKSVTSVETIQVVTLCWGKLCESYDSVLFRTPSHLPQPLVLNLLMTPYRVSDTPPRCHVKHGRMNSLGRTRRFYYYFWKENRSTNIQLEFYIVKSGNEF